MKLAESVVVQNFQLALRGQLALDASDKNVLDFCETVVAGTSDFLKSVAAKGKKVALSFADLKGNMILAAVLEYNENEEEGQDNFNYYWTFDNADIEDAVVYDVTQPNIQAVFVKRAAEMAHMKFTTPGSLPRMLTIFASSINDYLDQNAKPGETVTIEHEGFFVAEATVEGETIVKSFLPDGAMKKLIKDDAGTEV